MKALEGLLHLPTTGDVRIVIDVVVRTPTAQGRTRRLRVQVFSREGSRLVTYQRFEGTNTWTQTTKQTTLIPITERVLIRKWAAREYAASCLVRVPRETT